MSEIVQCQSCKADFESLDKIPMLLPCEHNICAVCAYDQHQRNKSIQCVYSSCQKVYQIHPFKLQDDSQLMKHLEQKVVLQNISLLENQQDRLTKAQAQLAKQKANMIYQIIQYLYRQVFADNITLQNEIISLDKEIKQQLRFLKLQQHLMNKKQNQQKIKQQVFNDKQVEKRVQKLIDDSQKITQKNLQLLTNLYENLAFMKNNPSQVTKASIYLQKQEFQQSQQVQNLKLVEQKFEYQQDISSQKEQTFNQQLSEQQTEKNQSQKLLITITSPNNDDIQIQTEQNTTIRQIKEIIKQKKELSNHNLILSKKNKELNDDQALSYYGLIDGDSVKMEMKQNFQDEIVAEFILKVNRRGMQVCIECELKLFLKRDNE